MKKIISVFLLITTLFCCLPTVSAAETYERVGNEYFTVNIEPRMNNVVRCNLDFVIDSSGLAYVTVDYSGMESTFTSVTITTKVQKKVMGIFWSTVGNGLPNDEWVTTSTDLYGNITSYLQLLETGTYRAVFEIVFSGTGGADDVIEDKIERTYG